MRDYPLPELVEYIDWTPFFHVWELKGVYPDILQHPKYGHAARDLHQSARKLLDRIVSQRLLTAHGVYGLFPASSDGEDIVLYKDQDDIETVKGEPVRAMLERSKNRGTRRGGRRRG